MGGLKEIQIPIIGSLARRRTNLVEVGGNLDANALSPEEAYPSLPGNTFPRPLGEPPTDDWRDARTYNFSTSIEAFDNLGKSHEFTYYFVKARFVPQSYAVNGFSKHYRQYYLVHKLWLRW